MTVTTTSKEVAVYDIASVIVPKRQWECLVSFLGITGPAHLRYLYLTKIGRGDGNYIMRIAARKVT